MTKLRQRMMEELRLRNPSEETIRSYVYSVERFAWYYHTSPDRMNAETLEEYCRERWGWHRRYADLRVYSCSFEIDNSIALG